MKKPKRNRILTLLALLAVILVIPASAKYAEIDGVLMSTQLDGLTQLGLASQIGAVKCGTTGSGGAYTCDCASAALTALTTRVAALETAMADRYTKAQVDALLSRTVRDMLDAIPNGANLNDYRSPGIWQWHSSNYGSPGVSNAPPGYSNNGYGTLKVEAGLSFFSQTLTLEIPANAVWIRTGDTSLGTVVWTAWKQIS